MSGLEKETQVKIQMLQDNILLNLDKEAWEKEQLAKKIVLPDSVKEKQDGSKKEKIPFHFFKVIEKGPDCLTVQIGDIVFPSYEHPFYQPIEMLGEIKFIIAEKHLAGIVKKDDDN
jgi:co-chaperonin GroES (HSP10)